MLRIKKRGTGNLPPHILTRQPTGAFIKQPSPPLCTLCLKRHLHRCSPWGAGREGRRGKKRAIYLQSSSGQLMSPPGPGTGGHVHEQMCEERTGLLAEESRTARRGSALPAKSGAPPIPALRSRRCVEGGCCLPLPGKTPLYHFTI